MASSLNFTSFENFVADSNKCTNFKLVTCPADLEEDFEEDAGSSKDKSNDSKQLPRIAAFKPDMSYSFFGENENIFGYKNLRVNLYYSCARLNIYLGMKYTAAVTKDKTGGVDADDVIKAISSDYETQICNNLTEFSSSLAKEKSFVPYGEVVEEFAIDYHPEDEQPRKRHFQIFKADTSVPGFPKYHERMQTFLKWYIEGASYIDMDDERWNFYVLYEKLPLDKAANGNKMPLEFQYCFVGYCSVYHFYAYPTNIRPRIAQFIILPPFQRLGLGTKLLKVIYSYYCKPSTTDIQVEDPSENFQLMRDILDCKLCQSLKSYSLEKLKQGWCKEMADEAREKHKIVERQARRVYEILRLKAVDRSNEAEYQAFRLSVKQRFNAPYQKQIRDIEKAKWKMSKAEYATTMKSTHIPREVRVGMLSQQYAELEKEYLAVVEKL